MRSLLLLSALLPLLLKGQTINAYAQITAISGATLTVGTSAEAATSFAAGKDVVIMQMQDDVIGANTGNNASFGSLSSIQQAGRYAVRRIVSVTRSGPTLTSIVLNASPGVTFNIGANCAVQAITYELLGGGANYTLSSPLSAMPWNGTIGGVLAFRVGGILTVGANITADGAGFRGGARDRFSYTSPCNTTDYIWSSIAAGTEYFATKGEGIYRNTNTAIADGRGKMLNGGGGANQINAGGGGGANYTAGGSAGLGWSCTSTAGGIGGVALSAHISASRVFMGGGGGGGEGNDDVSTDGANGGGIILIQASQLRTTGTCSVRISADGNAAATSGNDGAGGGGAGGSVILQVPTYSFSASCPLTIRANGGDGGTVNSNTHGGGGGGGQGAVIFSSSTPTGSVTIQTNSGTGGCNQTPCVDRAGNGAGTNGSGIIPGSMGPLPVELLSFAASRAERSVHVTWSTASEHDNDHFLIDRSTDMETWESVGMVSGAGNSLETRHYALEDPQPFAGLSFYRLKQVDTDGSTTTYDAVAVVAEMDGASLQVLPNPANDRVVVRWQQVLPGERVRLADSFGRLVDVPAQHGVGVAELGTAHLRPGVYHVFLDAAQERSSVRLVVER